MSRSRLPRSASVLALVALAAAGAAATARAQTGVWRQIPVPGSGISALARADSGTVLVANSQGAFRLDGIRARRIPIFSPTGDSLSGRAILQAENGDLWLGTSNLGLFRLRGNGAVTRYTAASGLGNFSNDEILALAQTPDGAIWAGTNLGGLSRFDGSSWTTLTTDQGLPSMTVTALAVSPVDGSLWAGCLGAQAGLVHVVQGTVRQVHDQFTLTTSENVQSVLVTRAGLVWVGNDAGIARLTGGAFAEFSAGTTVVTLAEGAHGEIWFGTGNRGVGRWDAGSLRLLPSGPPSSTIRSLLVDPAGVLWTGTTSALARFEGAAWLSHSRTDGLPGQAQVFAAFRDLRAEALGDSIDAQGIAWFGTSGTFIDPSQTFKLSRRANSRVRHFGTAQGLPVGSVSALVPADSGAIWCATAASGNGGLARVRTDGVVSRVIDTTQGLPSGYVLGLADAGGGAVWVATAAGGGLVDAGGFRPLRVGAGGLPDAPLVGVAADARGRAWFASGQNPFGADSRPVAGAVRFDPADSSWLVLDAAGGLPTDDLNGVTVAPNGDVWFATEAGAVRWRDGVLRAFGVADGLPARVVFQVAVDPSGMVWAATDEGLALFDGATWSSYNVGDGLIGTRVAAVHADSIGVIASCRLEGVSLFHPDRTPPRVEIPSGPAAATGSATVQFTVSAGDLDSDESRILVSSELVGGLPTPFLEDVSAISLDLLDGDYEFRVRAKDRALNVSAEPYVWRFTVDATPPRPVVQQPAFNAIVRDTVHVLGRVDDPRFRHYVIELRREGAVLWDTLLTSATPPPAGASLFDWASRDFDDGVWELRVGVEDSLGLIGYSQVSVIVDNLAPSATVTSPSKIDHIRGGSVFTTGGEVELYVPPNAFAADQIVRIDPLPVVLPRDLPGGRVLSAWRLDANDPGLAKPATLSIVVPPPAPDGDAPLTIARLVVAAGDTTLVPVGGARSADGTRLTTSISSLDTYVVASGVAVAQGFDGLRGLDCQPRVLSPRGGGFDVRTAISFELGQPGAGAIKVYDRAGRLVKEVVEQADFGPGVNVVYWDGTDGDGAVVPSGLYTVAVRFDGRTAVRTVAVANR